MLLAAVMPNVLYVGHWPGTAAAEVAHGHEPMTPAEFQDHQAHCHFGPSKCAGQPALVGTPWVGDSPELATPGGPTFAIYATSAAVPTEPPAAAIPHPPRAV